MNELDASNREITNVVGVLNEMSFRTRLLALNATLEAARTNEQRGALAGQAVEVERLARQSANTANELKELIRNSIAMERSGGTLSVESNKTLAGIFDAVDKLSLIAERISKAGGRQTVEYEHSSKPVDDMAQSLKLDSTLLKESYRSGKSFVKNSEIKNCLTAKSPGCLMVLEQTKNRTIRLWHSGSSG